MVTMTSKRSAAHRAKKKKGRPKKGLDFRFFLVVCLILAATGVFILVQHQYSVSSDLKVRNIEKKIEAEKANQKSLRISLAKLKSPARIARMAQDELRMEEPTGVIYLKYGRDEEGNLVCQSTFEDRAKAPPKKIDTGYEPEPETTEEPSGPLTLSAPFHEYGYVSRAPPRRSGKARDRGVLLQYVEGAERSRSGCSGARMPAYSWSGVLK